MRLFTAIELGDDVAARAGALVDELRSRAGRLAPAGKLTWVAADRMHLTLRFIGQVDETRAERVLQALRPAVSRAPFRIRWGSPGAFPARGAPRVLWMKPGIPDGSGGPKVSSSIHQPKA